MKKYFTLAKAELLDALNNKGEILLHVLLETVPLFIMCALWISNQAGSVALGYSSAQLVTYYLVMLIISRFTGFYFDQGVQNEIRDGTFSRYLVKPLAIPLGFIPQNIGGKIFHVGFLLTLVLAILLVILKNYIIFPSAINLILFGLSLLSAYLIQYTLSVIATTTAFYLEQASAFIHAKWMLEVVAGGYQIPLDIYPQGIQTIINLLPFKYLYFVPASIFLGRFSLAESVFHILISLLWVVAMLFISHFFWKKGLKKYSGVGG